MTSTQIPDNRVRRALTARPGKLLTDRSGSFARSEDGGMAIVGFFVFLIMILMGSLSIDVMRQEMERTELQAVNDSATLAGAGAPAEANAEDIRAIVEDFFVKSGKGDYLNEIGPDDIIARLNARVVSASANVTLNTYLMRLMGVDTLTATSAATAQVRTPKLEVVMVLDLSGSMAFNSRLENLKVAAKEFVTTVLSSSDPGDTVISVVPFSWGVTPSRGIFEALSVDQTHNYSTCLYFEPDDYNTAAIFPAPTDPNVMPVTYKQRIYTTYRGTIFDGLEHGSLADGMSPRYNRTCYTEEFFEIMPFSISEAALHDKIDSLQSGGSTSKHLGMKWGAGLLDPAFAPVITSLQTPRARTQPDGSIAMVTEVDPMLTNVPAPYDEPETQKVIVLMGDGQNDATFMFSDPNNHLVRSIPNTQGPNDYRGPGSFLHKLVEFEEVFDYAYDIYDPSRTWHGAWVEQYCWYSWLECVYTSTEDEMHYIFNPNNNRYYPVDGSAYLTAWQFNNLRNSLPATYVDDNGIEQPTHVNYDWETAWGRMSVRMVGELTGNWGPWNDFIGDRVTKDTKDTLLDQVCTATKANGVLVFSIGFEVENAGNADEVLRNCATSPAHYYSASGVQISDVFGSIAANVQSLRLTQ